MNNFEAILIKPISYTDVRGKPVTIPAGKRVTVSQVAGPLISFDLRGNAHTEDLETFYGTVGNDSFDLSPSEFRAMC